MGGVIQRLGSRMVVARWKLCREKPNVRYPKRSEAVWFQAPGDALMF